MNRLVKQLRKMRHDELTELSGEVNREIHRRLVQPDPQPATIDFGDYQPRSARAPAARGRRRAA
ncbi:MAG: hypothetical protein ACOC46_03760 [Pirellulales bacterium]